jgi:hypothetical protein
VTTNWHKQDEISQAGSERCSDREVCVVKHPKLEEGRTLTKGKPVDHPDGM